MTSTSTPLAASPSPTTNALFPALYLYPLNDTWAPKHISLTSGSRPSEHTKIGRQTSSKTAPGERNGYFDSKVLSRQHAEVWEEGGKIYVKDVKSSNGTFINGERLSSEGHESEPFELKSDDIVEFGIDIVGEDNRTVIHHKVAARVVCVFNEQDAQVAARAEQHQHQHQQQVAQQQFVQGHQQHQITQGQGSGHHLSIGAGGSGGTIGRAQGVLNGLNAMNMNTLSLANPSSNPQQHPQNSPFAPRRSQQQQQQQQLAPCLGSMGALSSRAAGTGTGLTFDVILSRMHGEIKKSRVTETETSAELGRLMGVPGIHHNFPTHLPPVHAPTDPASTSGSLNASISVPASVTHLTSEPHPFSASASITSISTPAAPLSSAEHSISSTSTSSDDSALRDIKSQLLETQHTLAAQVTRVRHVEEVMKEQEEMRREVGVLRGLVMEQKVFLRGEAMKGDGNREEEDWDEKDDARSFETIRLGNGGKEEEEEEEGDGEGDVFRAPVLDKNVDGDEGEDEDDSHSEFSSESEVEATGTIEELAGDKMVDEFKATKTSDTADDEEEDSAEARIRRKREDLGVGRPHTPEPGSLGMDRRGIDEGSLERDGEHYDDHDHAEKVKKKQDETYEQLAKLSAQLSSVFASTTALEKQHDCAQDMIGVLVGRVGVLEGEMLDVAARGVGVDSPTTKAMNKDADTHATSTVDINDHLGSTKHSEQAFIQEIQSWQSFVEGLLEDVRGEWNSERERMQRTREELEGRTRDLEGKVAGDTTGGEIGSYGERVKRARHRGGLVTPPSPRSQSSSSSSDSLRGRGRVRPGVSGTESAASASASGTSANVSEEGKMDPTKTLATPEGSVYILCDAKEGNIKLKEVGKRERETLGAAPLASEKGSDLDRDDASVSQSLLCEVGQEETTLNKHASRNHNVNNNRLQTAFGIAIISVAAAAVFWKIKPE